MTLRTWARSRFGVMFPDASHRARLHALAWAERRRREEREHAKRLLQSERNLAHRELQLQRANASRKGSYITERQRKLREAQREVAHLREATAM